MERTTMTTTTNTIKLGNDDLSQPGQIEADALREKLGSDARMGLFGFTPISGASVTVELTAKITVIETPPATTVNT